MEVRALSATAIRDWLLCNLKLKFRYDRDIPSVKTDHARVGIAVHNALEQFSKRMRTKKSFPDPSDYEFAINTFMNSATSEGLQEMSFYTDGRKMITAFIDKYDTNEEILDVEYKFKLTTPEGVPISGAIDKIVKINDDTLSIVDYKTARNALTEYELQDDIQLSMYDLAISLAYPNFKNRLLSLDYVRIDKKVKTYRTDEDRKAFRAFLSSIWSQINMAREEDLKGRINNLCGWCDYKTYCQDYAQFLDSKNLALQPLTNMNDAEFLEHWESVSSMKSILESRQRELKMLAHEKFMRGEGIKSNSKELYSTQNSRTSYEIQDVIRIIPEKDLLPLLNVSKSNIDRYAKDDPELKNKLARIAQVSYNSPMYKTRALKEEDDGRFTFNEEIEPDQGAA
jgi:putative RecB family exonuclease